LQSHKFHELNATSTMRAAVASSKAVLQGKLDNPRPRIRRRDRAETV
jgi:hypothetical protein